MDHHPGPAGDARASAFPPHSTPPFEAPDPSSASEPSSLASTPGEKQSSPRSDGPGRPSAAPDREFAVLGASDVPGAADPVTRLSLDALVEAAAETAREGGGQARLMTAARAARRPTAATTGAAAPYAARVAAMDALLASAEPGDWSVRIVEGWTLQQLVAHLAATDSLVAAAIGAPVAGPAVAADEVLSRTADMLAFVAGQTPERTRADWRLQADAICRHAASMEPSTMIAPGGLGFPVADHLLARMLETWIHTDDAAAVLGRPLPLPLDGHIHPTADFCARLLPWTMLLSGVEGGDRSIRLTLTGPGGGVWHVPLDVARPAVPDDGSPVQAAITCDAVAFCFLLGGRGAPATFPAEVEGDAGLAREVLRTAPALSGP
ncbi:maleylpyruvate isomerase family mycothiol-dependent enzyme [Sphaerisporangium dianthi]|uniref:Maleylpyruvate isomerase family mycothiol-dependent enzyme n=1 Tax=Sphaerisporangium dianthi TaxID=1436120 RepID=A0ABV9CFA6_9ACTN